MSTNDSGSLLSSEVTISCFIVSLLNAAELSVVATHRHTIRIEELKGGHIGLCVGSFSLASLFACFAYCSAFWFQTSIGTVMLTPIGKEKDVFSPATAVLISILVNDSCQSILLVSLEGLPVAYPYLMKQNLGGGIGVSEASPYCIVTPDVW